MRNIVLIPLLVMSCRTSSSNLFSHQDTACQGASSLERSLSLLAPNELDPALSVCLVRQFQDNLNREKNETKDKMVNDVFDYQEVLEASSFLGKDIYSRKNIVDKKVYIKGPEIFGAHRRLIAAAQEEVLIQTYVWESVSSSAKEILTGLQELEKNHRANCANCSPVIVRIVANHGPTALDIVASITGNEKVSDSGADARVAVKALNLDPRVVDAEVLTYKHKALGTNHAKNIVVDGQIAIVTGANPQRFNDPDINWNDLGFMVGGDVVRGLRKDLINNLVRARNGKESDGNQELAASLKTPYNKVFEKVSDVRSQMADPYEDPVGIPILITGRNGNGFPSNSNNNTQDRGFQSLFQSARQNIRIQTPNFNDDAAVRGLGSAIRRGVRVEMVHSKLFNCASENIPSQGGQNEKGISRLLEEIGASSPQSERLGVRWFSMEKNGQFQTVFDNPKGKAPETRPNNSHAKFMTVDDEVAVIGSANHDTQSWNQSREINLMVFNSPVVKSWVDQVFTPNYGHGIDVTADELIAKNIKCK